MLRLSSYLSDQEHPSDGKKHESVTAIAPTANFHNIYPEVVEKYFRFLNPRCQIERFSG